MKRRTFLSMVAGLTLVPGLLLAQTNLMYTDGLIQKHLDEGKSVFVITLLTGVVPADFRDS